VSPDPRDDQTILRLIAERDEARREVQALRAERAGGQPEGEPERCGGAGSWADCSGCKDCTTDPEESGR
jgi:hypothetical protein